MSPATAITPTVLALHCSADHAFSKRSQPALQLIAGHGVEGDAHAGVTVQHLSRVARDPTQPNLRQVHLLQAELLDELAERGFTVRPGDLGENITTRHIDLLALSAGTRLHLGPQVVLQVTGLRNPCHQINRFQPGLMDAVLARDAQGGLIRKAGVMAVVLTGGLLRVGDTLRAEWLSPPYQGLLPV